MNILQDLKEIFKDTQYSVSEYKITSELDQQVCYLKLFNKDNYNRVSLELNIHKVEDIHDQIVEILKLQEK
jgi:hypothetical protein